MADSTRTVWPADPHTLAKHAILRRYLDAWFPILTRQSAKIRGSSGGLSSREVLYIDGFAGPGIYAGGEPGSPIIALNAALSHRVNFPRQVRMLFVEKELSRFERLTEVLVPKLEDARKSNNVRAVEPRHGGCDEVLNSMLDGFEAQHIDFGPALAFLDQFGYAEVSMDLIARIMRFDQCEVFTYLNFNAMNRWIGDVDKDPAFERTFGGDDWRECVSLPEGERRGCLLNTYKNALRKRANANYVVSFLMFGKRGQPLYWLLFCTNNLRGLEEMKKAMWSVDRSGEFRFSDRDDPQQLDLLDKRFDDDWLAKELSTELGGKTLTVASVKEFVLVETPCYKFKEALRRLETQGRLQVVGAAPTRRPGTFPDERIKIRFHKSLF